MQTDFDPNFLSELIDSAHNPPGNDPVLKSFYTAIVEMVEEGNISGFLSKIKDSRKDTTYKHLVNLLYRSFQAIKFKQNDFSYRDFKDVHQWINELKSLISNQKTKSYFEKLLLTKSTTTTIYQRYAGPYGLVAYLFDGQDVRIADLGCGGNYGLRGIATFEPFKKIKDQTSGRLVNKMLAKKISLNQGIALDKEDPDSPEVKLWRLACSFYPKELGEVKQVLSFEERIKKTKAVKFLKIDLLTTKMLPQIKVNVAILSTILYQLNFEQQLLMIEQAKKVLSRDGLLIVQDFAAKNLANPKHLDFNESWFGKSFSYRTFISGPKTNFEFWEILRWDSGRCQMVKNGEDFEKLAQLL